MSDSANRERQIFVLHLWTEPDRNGPGSHRGYIEFITSGKRQYFSQIDEALAFVATLMGDAPASEPGDIRD